MDEDTDAVSVFDSGKDDKEKRADMSFLVMVKAKKRT